MPIHLLTSPEQSKALAERILNSACKRVGVDCEGSHVGRFGRLSVLQLATEKEIYLVDVLKGGPQMLDPLVPVLESTAVVKVLHDCREDSSLLSRQHGVELASVFDTQVGHAVWLERKRLDIYQASVAEVLRTFQLATYRAHRWDDLERRAIPPYKWEQRPIDPHLLRYAIEGVAHLLPLQRAICRALSDKTGDLVLRRSVRYVAYAKLNHAELPTEDTSFLAPGTPLQAMLATRIPDGAYFKLNHHALTGAVLNADHLKEFRDMQPGDVARCRVSSVSECRQFVHLVREGHGNLFYDQRRLQMRGLPSQEDVDAVRPGRQSSFYGFGESAGEAIREERADFRERKPDVIYKSGKRGAVKIRKTEWRPPKKQVRGRDEF